MSKAGEKELQRRALDQANLERRVQREVGLQGSKPPNSSGPKPLPGVVEPALPATAPTPSRAGGRKSKPKGRKTAIDQTIKEYGEREFDRARLAKEAAAAPKPTATIAPPGVCDYCDNRRANIAASVIKHRKAKKRAEQKSRRKPKKENPDGP